MSQTLFDALPTADADCMQNTSALRRDQEPPQRRLTLMRSVDMHAGSRSRLPARRPYRGREATSCREVAGVSGFTDGRSPEIVNWGY